MASEMKEAIMMDIVLSVTSNHANDWANEMYNPQTFAQVPKSFFLFYFTIGATDNNKEIQFTIQSYCTWLEISMYLWKFSDY